MDAYVRLAVAGETVLVMDRGRVVAEIGLSGEARNPILTEHAAD